MVVTDVRCEVGIDAGDRALPVVGTGALARVRKSKRSKWRAAVLISVHALVAAHIAHYLVAGRTLSPVEPSESAFTIEMGYVTAGCVFLVVALLGTLFFGRFFCGWGCHIVALQDLCAWIMKKLGVRPRPFRARLMAFLPLAVALYMFAWPAVQRWTLGSPSGPFQGFTNHLLTDSLWKTFPGPVIAALTFLTCGFAAVYFLGAKGFCTYGCPYGALFGPIDTLSLGRIVVSDACEQCGHCTASCTSNVRVHEEVRRYGMVVDSGCMKCLDCVSVCPKGALRFAFARPALFKRAPSSPGAKRYDLPLVEELLAGATCVLGTLVFVRLYDGPPLLLSAGLGSLTAFVALKAWHLFRRPNVQVQNLTLKSAGRVKPHGWAFAALASLWLAFTAHSAFVQWHRIQGVRSMNRMEVTRNEVLSGAFAQKRYSPQHYLALSEAERHLALAARWGLLNVMEIDLCLSWVDMLRGDLSAAETHARRAVATAPEEAGLTMKNLSDVLLAGGKIPEAIEVTRSRLGSHEASAANHFELAGLLAMNGSLEEAASEYAACISMAPESADVHLGFGEVLMRLGRHQEALEQLLTAARIAPRDATVQLALGLTQRALGADTDARRSLERALELGPEDPEIRVPARRALEELGPKPPA